MKKSKVIKYTKMAVMILLGQFIGAYAFTAILLPNSLTAGGFGGVATVLNQLFGWNIQVVLIVLCTPIIVWY